MHTHTHTHVAAAGCNWSYIFMHLHSYICYKCVHVMTVVCRMTYESRSHWGIGRVQMNFCSLFHNFILNGKLWEGENIALIVRFYLRSQIESLNFIQKPEVGVQWGTDKYSRKIQKLQILSLYICMYLFIYI